MDELQNLILQKLTQIEYQIQEGAMFRAAMTEKLSILNELGKKITQDAVFRANLTMEIKELVAGMGRVGEEQEKIKGRLETLEQERNRAVMGLWWGKKVAFVLWAGIVALLTYLLPLLLQRVVLLVWKD